jgi:Flp pilus assembly pilin Flp
MGAHAVGRTTEMIRGPRGQGVVEYGLILALSSLVAIALLVFFGGTMAIVLDAIGEAIEQAS